MHMNITFLPGFPASFLEQTGAVDPRMQSGWAGGGRTQTVGRVLSSRYGNGLSQLDSLDYQC